MLPNDDVDELKLSKDEFKLRGKVYRVVRGLYDLSASNFDVRLYECDGQYVVVKCIESPENQYHRGEFDSTLLRKYGTLYDSSILKVESKMCDGKAIVIAKYEGNNFRQIRNKMQDTDVTVSIVIQLMFQITCTLKTMHDNGLVHRDVKPSNVFGSIEHGIVRAVLGDLGLVIDKFSHGATDSSNSSHDTDGNNHQETSSRNIGTLGFQAPEVKEDPNSIKRKSDIWSLGKLFNCCVFTFMKE